MNPFSVLTLAIFIAGYITASWDLGIRLYELAIFAWDTGVFVRPLRAQHIYVSYSSAASDSVSQRLCHNIYLLLRLHNTNRTDCCTRSHGGMVASTFQERSCRCSCPHSTLGRLEEAFQHENNYDAEDRFESFAMVIWSRTIGWHASSGPPIR